MTINYLHKNQLFFHIFLTWHKAQRCNQKGNIYLFDKAADQAQLAGYWHPYLGTEKEIYRVAVGFLYKKIDKKKEEVLTIDSS